MPAAAVIDVTDATFEADVLAASRGRPIVVDFWAPWCGPCRTLGPTLERLAEEHGGDFVLARLNTDENPGVSSAFQIQSIPAVMAFRDGQAVDQFVGALPEPQVRAFVERLLPSEADAIAARGAGALAERRFEDARADFGAALALDHAHPRAVAGLTAVLIEAGDLDEAEQVAGRLPAHPNVKRQLARIHFLRGAEGADRDDLEARLARDADDVEANYRLGCLLATEAQWEPAIDHLLAVVALDRKFADDGARRRVLEVLEVIGDDHPLAREARQRLTMLLF